jgi:hypothetical protein
MVCYLISQCQKIEEFFAFIVYFLEKSPFIHTFKQQISDLVVTINYEITNVSMQNLLIDIYYHIFGLLANLKYLDLDVNNIYSFSSAKNKRSINLYIFLL